ncbi:hypothetical protein COLU111180_16350 [Cohnella lubricantis]|uniref:Uncharacterized protein n=1 Tax=Cohnella lubricantis TaxID=2163172 RepID=A0A841TCD7_9BACL|nr:hypothetical protein [Cohnella lubricantis]MBB6676111.1 hypothetical protein [Cohnella lubricantis]MBP2119276.1 guanyl-specific ribonuclease Sa [Cohnella lubricantis]
MSLYIPYTFFMVLGLIVLVAALLLIKRRRAARYILIAALPVLLLIQCYFWNAEFNLYAKSYLFASRSYQCEYADEQSGLSIPLPRRTVILGREDGCSPFYFTYVDASQFKSFYDKELARLKEGGDIVNYRCDEREDRYAARYKEYAVDTPGGSQVTIAYRQDAGGRFISIDMNPGG